MTTRVYLRKHLTVQAPSVDGARPILSGLGYQVSGTENGVVNKASSFSSEVA